MHYYEVAPTRIVRADSGTLTYSSSQEIPIGTIVSIPVGRSVRNGVVIKRVAAPAYEVKPVGAIIEATPLPIELVQLAEWMSSYYSTHLATVLTTILPSGVGKKRRANLEKPERTAAKRTNFVLNSDQRHAVQTISKSANSTTLLHGITGSGKTAVYQELANQARTDGKSTIILVPEIALTSQLIQSFSQKFKNVYVTHSRQTEAERHMIWRSILDCSEPIVVIGPRSALFMPIRNLGLIVIDEAHEPTYKQEQSPRYHATAVASILARQHGAKVVLGSATPSVTDYFVAKERGAVVSMTKLASSGAVRPVVKVIDMTKRTHFKRHRFLSDQLLSDIEQTLASGNQVLIFHNRRGSTSITLCETCGWNAGCPKCFLPLTLHADQHRLRCHTCGYTTPVPTSCPVDGSTDIIHKGIGTKLIETELKKLFPKSLIARFDGDTAASESVDERYSELKDGTIDIIIGTQVIAKGLDLPKLRVVGIVQADAGLGLPDYSSAERSFQLLAQAVGRVGRFEHPTTVVVQSYQPTHPIITAGLTQDYESFYQTALLQRKAGTFPPFTYLLKLVCIYKTETAAIKNARALSEKLRENLPQEVEILGPTPAFYERAGGSFRWQLVVKSPKRSHLLTAVEMLPPAHWQFELDPVSLLS